MILLLTNERDLTTDYVVRELKKRELPYFRLNSERLAEADVKFSPHGAAWQISIQERTISTKEIGAAYFRRPGTPIASSSVASAAERAYCEHEWLSVLHSLYSALEDRWLNSPAHIAAAEDKPRQLTLASKIGFAVPDTLITNDPAAVRLFRHDGAAVVKTLRASLLTDPNSGDERVIFTNRLNDDLGREFEDSLRVAPVILQREVEKDADIRVTVVGDYVMAARIDSQNLSETVVDWRKGAHVDLPHTQHILPADLEMRCRQLTAALKLKFAAIDFVLDRFGKYWFLEANPNGQWAWIEARTGHPIAARMVDLLVAMADSDGAGT